MLIEAKKLIPGKNLGPVISKASYEWILGFIDEAEKAGAKVILDGRNPKVDGGAKDGYYPVSYTHLRAHETVLDLVCRLLLEKKKTKNKQKKKQNT